MSTQDHQETKDSGRENADGFYWTLFINNELSVKGATQSGISPADSIEWRYQKGI